MEAIWKKIGFLPILAKKHGLTPWDFGQNFKFAKTFCIGKRRREMMFGDVFRVIGSNLEENWFLADFGQKAWTNPWDFGQNFNFAKTFCIGKRRREMMFGVILRVIGSNLGRKLVFSQFWPKSMD